MTAMIPLVLLTLLTNAEPNKPVASEHSELRAWWLATGIDAEHVWPGTRVVTPEDLKCGLDGGIPSHEVTLVEPGHHTVNCVDRSGEDVPPFTVDVIDVKATLKTLEGNEPNPRYKESTPLRLHVDTPIPLPKGWRLAAGAGIQLGEPMEENPGTWRVTVTPDLTAPPQNHLSLLLGRGDNALELVNIPLNLALEQSGGGPPCEPCSTTTSSPSERRRELHMVEFSASGGMAFVSDNHELYDDTSAQHQEFQTVTFALNARVGYYPIRWVGIELENSVYPSSVENGRAANLYAFRGQVVGQLPYQWTPFLTVGVGSVAVNSKSDAVGRDVDAMFHFGGGVKFYWTRWLNLRIEVRDSIGPRRGDGVAHLPEVLGGVGFVLGRRSARRQ